MGSYCNQRGTRCCYPPTGKPNPDFTIYGLWPYYNDGSFPYNCGDDNYDVGRVCSSILTWLEDFCVKHRCNKYLYKILIWFYKINSFTI